MTALPHPPPLRLALRLALLPDDRPRERLTSLGAECLADAELVALLLGSGRRGENALELAARLLGAVGGLPGLAQAEPGDLTRQAGIGDARAAVLKAAVELGRRVTGARPERGRRLAAAAEVWTHYRARLAHATVEEFWVLGLDVRHRLQFEACVARGCLTGVEVHPREVFRPLIRASAAAALFCHNHPSGDPTPSRQDFELTRRLKEVGELCGIAVLDHVVVGAEGYTSLAERGWL
jgi:DNA repair protein RadC